MGVEVIMPALGMAQDSGKLIAWRKKPGDAVAEGDLLFEVETDKSVSEVEAQASGFLTGVTASEGDDVPVGQVIAMITETTDEATGGQTPVPATPRASTPAPKAAAAPEPQTPAAPIPQPEGRILASPKARRVAAERGLDLARLAAAGHKQPFHMSDLDVLAAMPGDGTARSAAARSMIAGEVDSTAFYALIGQMRDSAGLELDPHALVAGFAAAAFRAAAGPDAEDERLVVAVSRGSIAADFRYADPDRTRPTRPRFAGAEERVSLILRDMTGTRLTGVSLASDDAPTLMLGGGAGQPFRVSLSFGDSLGDEAAFDMIGAFMDRLAAPLEHIV